MAIDSTLTNEHPWVSRKVETPIRGHRFRVGYQYQPARITYWSDRTFANIRQARHWSKRLNRRGNLPGTWVVRV